MPYFKAFSCTISWDGTILSKVKVSDDLKKKARHLLWSNGYTTPMRFQLVVLNNVRGLASKFALQMRDKTIKVLKTFDILVLLRSTKRRINRSKKKSEKTDA